MKKSICAVFALIMLFAGAALAAPALVVSWSAEALAPGAVGVGISGAEDGKTAVAAVFDGDMLTGVVSVGVIGGKAELSVNVGETDDRVRLMLWDMSGLSAELPPLAELTPDGVRSPLPLPAEAVGLVWDDENRDGVKGEDEKPLAGVIVTLDGEDYATGEDGAFTARGLKPGMYVVSVNTPEGYECTTDNASEIELKSGETTRYDIGFAVIRGSAEGATE